MKFTLHYDLAGDAHGWADASIVDAESKYEIESISYLSDAFESLSQAVLDLLNGVVETCCTFDHEPGRTRFRLTQQNGWVLVLIYEFKQELSDEPWDKGEKVKGFSVELRRLKSQYLNVADKMLSEYGENKYKKIWGHPFPVEIYQAIKNI